MSQSEDDQAEPSGHALSDASSLSAVSEPERKIIEAHSRPNAALIHETIRAEGESELSRPVTALLLSGLAAGLAMGFSLIAEGVLRAHLPDAPWRDLVAKFGYTIGFLIVVLGRQQLFTENTLTPVLPLLYNRDLRTLGLVVRLWALVLAANLAGTWAISAVLAGTSLFPPEVKEAFLAISRHVVEGSFWITTMRGIFAGWLIALMVWLIPGAGQSRSAVIVLLTWLVTVAGFAHIVVGSVDASFLVLSDQASITDYLWRFFTPTLLGNVVGGVALVAALNSGQVASAVQD
ncbi:formate/nitrite transporter family protein [Lichenicola cladoniae]|uniref:Formate/nitrite transporter family protein n=1 Tax=Lichenicola cladoniae TaxID=1484109 RepID=A0A6M8HNF1_9PROT|nr:formate/nitrite transporter family protein [Lichenicola cladoniae]NPD67524.1 formate/nitrite transporter family protein [Acetobacteraceae bacterium]QKE89953.1 formate/nitrite transporter family protein [Lichenicola cladoniae]